MRDTETRTPTMRFQALRAVASVAAIGLALCAGPVFANEDDEPARDDGLIGNLMRGIGATDGSNGIQYRERSPLVVPRQLTLPEPEGRRPETANWPKDPDVLERRAKREALKKRDREKENNPAEQIRPEAAEPVLGQARARTATVAPQPGVSEERRIINEGSGILSPSQLGVTTNLFGLFKGSGKDESKEFVGEPTRESLTQPPPGYQTPTAGYAYGTGPKKPEFTGNPDRQPEILAPGKF
jgi:hypothetical protein